MLLGNVHQNMRKEFIIYSKIFSGHLCEDEIKIQLVGDCHRHCVTHHIRILITETETESIFTHLISWKGYTMYSLCEIFKSYIVGNSISNYISSLHVCFVRFYTFCITRPHIYIFSTLLISELLMDG